MELRAPGQSLSAVCIHCGSTLDVTDPNFRVIQEADARIRYKPIIPLGTRGKLNGITWEVTGFLVRRAPAYDFRWSEYLLFNPIHGYRWLTHINNHWSLVSPLIAPPIEKPDSVMEHEGRPYKYFSGSIAEVFFVLGEFYWKVERGSRVQMADFIAPPLALSRELDSEGKVWSKSEYLSPDVVKEAFQLKDMPSPVGVAYNQPNPYSWMMRRVGGVMLGALVLMLVTMIVHFSASRKVVVHEERFGIVYGKDTSLVSQPFDIPGALGNVEISIDASLSNAWIETDGYLSREGDTRHHNFQLGTSYWHGTEYDYGSWAEGSQKARRLISAIPGGSYQLTLHTAAGEDPVHTPASVCTVDLRVTRGVPFFSNFWLFGGVVVLPFLVLMVLHTRFESKRKENA